ncbi:MAG: glutaredoxin family protein [Thermoplasmatales archaeon]|nr:MAG: glutaredoxin family protein [Thermoplasmatales archaeon]
MKIEHIKGENKGKIMLYALSTCAWCKKTKELLDDLGVEYHFINVDHLVGNDKETTEKEIIKWNPRRSFPTLVINDKECIVGFKEEKIKEALGV